ncbi:HlyD family secretion protein [Mucilaginibacter sp. SP1R1]|uniref:HlyD family secretion protein n=1 Tax=Mucilaginibacter sp. SP1R1 TaxID=2723091 RepID=UPI001622EB50|nr:HlyD family secretion protein [Mucilaginibacter sp. SP1R1]MBB6152621.1 membrane fusion protein (multidrug efflux system) [Mucilaginibacter sp. SP1R1]
MNTQNTYTTTDKLITKITSWIAGAIALVLLAWGIISLYQFYTSEQTDDAQVEEYINPVTSRVSGYIKEIKYDENQDVKKGDTLLIIDNREYALQREEGEAGLQNARSQIQVLESNVQTATKIAQVNNAQIAAVKAKLVKQQQEYDRYQKLYDVESATKQQLENVKSALDVAQADYQTALNNYQASLSKVNDSRSQISPVLSEIKRRELMLQRNQLDVSYTVITAPYDGKMGRRTIQAGQQIQVGQTLAFIVDKETGKWVIANFKETQLKDIRIGKKVIITTDAYPNTKIAGVVVSFSPATGSRFSLLPPDNSTGNFVKIAQRIPVKIKITDNNAIVSLLSAGMNASVTVPKNSADHD